MTGPALQISRSQFPVTALGPGERLGVWVQGCPLACKGCMARDTWAPDGGTEVPVAQLARDWRAALESGAHGLTVSGGEPLAQSEALRVFLETARGIADDWHSEQTERTRRHIRRTEPEPDAMSPGEADFEFRPDILLYTGYELDELDPEQRQAAACADVLVTGRYEAAQPTTLLWRGSANQRMHLQTGLARQRYAGFVDARPDHPPIQIQADGEILWMVGVPRQGMLAALDRTLREHGLGGQPASWRPGGAVADPDLQVTHRNPEPGGMT